MAETNIKVLKIEVDTGTGEIKVNGLKTSIDGLDKSVDNFTKSLRENKTANEQFASAAGIAGATVNEFGRFISDLPFGVTAVTNNISQLGSMFAILVQKAQKLNTGLSTTKNVLKLLKDQLLGPVGVLLLFQAAVALVETFAGSAKKAAKETDKMVEALSKVEDPIYEMEALAEIMESNSSSVEDQTKALAELKKLGFDPLNESLEVFKNRYTEIITLTAIKGVFAERIAEVVKERLTLEDEIKKLRAGLVDEDTFLESIADFLNIPLQEASNALASMKLNLSGAAFTAIEGKLQEEADRFKQTIKEIVKSMAPSENKDLDKAIIDGSKRRLSAFEDELKAIQALIDEYSKKLFDEAKKEEPIRFFDYDFDDLDVDEAIDKLLQDNKDREKERIKSLDRLAAVAQATGAIISGVADNIDAAYQKEIDIEQNKTNALNNELRARLANEHLSANERKNIQNQIAKNDEALRKKQEEIEKKRFKANKAAAIAEATVNTFLAATGVLRDTKGDPVMRIAAMVAVIGAGLAQVAMIAKQQFVSSQSSIGAGVGTTTGAEVQAPDFNIVGASQTNQIAEAIQGRLQTPIKAYVVSKDVSTAQEMDRNIVGTASLG